MCFALPTFKSLVIIHTMYDGKNLKIGKFKLIERAHDDDTSPHRAVADVYND